MELINKSALVAEIERRKCQFEVFVSSFAGFATEGLVSILNQLKDK